MIFNTFEGIIYFIFSVEYSSFAHTISLHGYYLFIYLEQQMNKVEWFHKFNNGVGING